MALKNKLDWIQTKKVKFDPKTVLSSSDLEDGQIELSNDGLLYIYDNSRTKWISIQRQIFVFGRQGTTNDQYLNFSAGTLPSSVSGFRVLRNACITGMTIQTSTSNSYNIRIRKNDSETNIYSAAVIGTGDTINNINTNINTNDRLQCYLEFTGTGDGVDDPVVMIELAWRK